MAGVAKETSTRHHVIGQNRAVRNCLIGLYPLPDAQGCMEETKQEAARKMLAGAVLGDFSGATKEAIELQQTVAKIEAKKDGNHPIDDDAKMGLTRLSMAQGAQLVLKKLLMATAEDQTEACQIFDESLARAQLNKKSSGANGPGTAPAGQQTQ